MSDLLRFQAVLLTIKENETQGFADVGRTWRSEVQQLNGPIKGTRFWVSGFHATLNVPENIYWELADQLERETLKACEEAGNSFYLYRQVSAGGRPHLASGKNPFEESFSSALNVSELHFKVTSGIWQGGDPVQLVGVGSNGRKLLLKTERASPYHEAEMVAETLLHADAGGCWRKVPV